MYKTAKSLIFILMASLAAACSHDDIMTFSVENSSVSFQARSYQFSLKGMTADIDTLHLSLTLVGQAADYDRPVKITAGENTSENAAVEGVDFTLVDAKIAAGALSGQVSIAVKALNEEHPKKTTVLTIEPNEYFRSGYPAYMSAQITWSEEYVRPVVYVWRYWHTFMSNYYSKALHQIYIQVLGEEFEVCTCSKLYAANYGLVYKSPFWWYSASRQVRSYVAAYDAAHPDAPLMHSSDVMRYGSYLTADGEGIKPDREMTILETLMSI